LLKPNSAEYGRDKGMVKLEENDNDRINFTLTGELALFVKQMKERGIHQDNADIVRAALVQLRYYYQQIRVIE
jgi:hypothetical protein